MDLRQSRRPRSDDVVKGILEGECTEEIAHHVGLY